MKHVCLPFIMVLLALSCADRGSGTKPVSDAPNGEPERIKGTVTSAFSGEGCPWLVLLDTPTEVGPLIPIALEERYLRDGMRIAFSYRLSRASSGACKKGTPAILEDIAAL